jgi:hypothetical protein
MEKIETSKSALKESSLEYRLSQEALEGDLGELAEAVDPL